MRRCGFKIVIYINVLTEKNITLTAVFNVNNHEERHINGKIAYS
jgi:hypothetical protein